MNRTINCLRCGAPMNPPRSGYYNCEFCGASYFAGGMFSRAVHYINRVSQTKGFNSSIIIPAGFGSILLVLLIFRYPSFQRNKVENIPTPTKTETTYEEDVIKESIKETIKIIPQLLNQEISKERKLIFRKFKSQFQFFLRDQAPFLQRKIIHHLQRVL